MENEEPNPADELLQIPLAETLKAVHVINATSQLILENQIEIMSHLSGKDKKDVRESVMKRFDNITKEMLDKLPKTV
jgi:hypothetical protein